MIDFVLLGLYLQIFLQMSNTVLAYKIYKIINHGNWWWLLSGGFFLMSLRRITALISYTQKELTVILLIDKLVLPIAITILIFIGLSRTRFACERQQCIIRTTEARLAKLKQLTERLNTENVKVNHKRARK